MTTGSRGYPQRSPPSRPSRPSRPPSYPRRTPPGRPQHPQRPVAPRPPPRQPMKPVTNPFGKRKVPPGLFAGFGRKAVPIFSRAWLPLTVAAFIIDEFYPWGEEQLGYVFPAGWYLHCRDDDVRYEKWGFTPGHSVDCGTTNQVPGGDYGDGTDLTPLTGASGAQIHFGRSQLGGMRMELQEVWRHPPTPDAPPVPWVEVPPVTFPPLYPPSPWPLVDPWHTPIGVPTPTPQPIPYPALPHRKPIRERSPNEQPQWGPPPVRRPLPAAPPTTPGIEIDKSPGRPIPGPNPPPGPSPGPVPGPGVQPGPGVKPAPGPGVQIKHEIARPPPRTRERKTIWAIHNASKLGKLINMLTETADFIDAVYEAIPDKYRKKNGGFGEEKGKTPQGKAYQIYLHLDKIPMEEVIDNLVYEHFEDKFYGKLGKTAAANNRRIGREVGLQFGYAL